MRHNYWACVLKLLTLYALEPMLCIKRSHHSENPAHHSQRGPPAPHSQRKSVHSNEDSVSGFKETIWNQIKGLQQFWGSRCPSVICFAWQSNKVILLYFMPNSVYKIQFSTGAQRSSFQHQHRYLFCLSPQLLCPKLGKIFCCPLQTFYFLYHQGHLFIDLS